MKENLRATQHLSVTLGLRSVFPFVPRICILFCLPELLPVFLCHLLVNIVNKFASESFRVCFMQRCSGTSECTDNSDELGCVESDCSWSDSASSIKFCHSSNRCIDIRKEICLCLFGCRQVNGSSRNSGLWKCHLTDSILSFSCAHVRVFFVSYLPSCLHFGMSEEHSMRADIFDPGIESWKDWVSGSLIASFRPQIQIEKTILSWMQRRKGKQNVLLQQKGPDVLYWWLGLFQCDWKMWWHWAMRQRLWRILLFWRYVFVQWMSLT